MIIQAHSPATRLRFTTGFAAALFGILLILPAPAAAQECSSEWRDPVVCAVELSIASEGERRASLIEGNTLELRTRTTFDVYADPIDQWGERFPQRRFGLHIEHADPRGDCNGLVTIEQTEDPGRFALETGGRTGTCDLLLWVPGNMNLDRELRIEVSRERAGDGFARKESELLARWLFQGILGREVDDSGLRAAATAIESGRLQPQVEAMVRSPEFRKQRAGLPPHELLEDLYLGILGRKPDTSGVRAYLDTIQRGDVAGVALELVQSKELEDRLDEAMHTRIDF